MNSLTDGTPLTTGVSFNYDGGTYGAGAGTLTHRGGGLWRYVPTQAETNVNSFGYQFAHATGLAQGGTVLTTAADPTDAVRFGLSALPNAAAGGTGGLPTRGGAIPDATAGAAGGLLLFGTGTGAINPSGGKVPATLAATDVTGNVAADVQTIKTQTITCAAGVTVLANVGTATAALVVDASGRVDVGKILGTASAGAAGYVGLDWGHITAPTTAVNLSGTTISTAQAVASVSGSVGSVTGSVGSVTGDVGGKVLGGGASLLTGAGVRALDASGNALAPAATALSTAQWTNTRAGYLDSLPNLDTTVSSRSTYAGADTAGTTTLLARLTGTLALDGSGRVLLQPSQPGVTIPTVTDLTDPPADSTTLTRLATTIELSGSAYRFTAAALAQAPTGGGGSDPWATPLPGTYAPGTAGAILPGRMAATDYDPPASAGEIATAVATALSTAHGAGSWTTADVSGLASGTTPPGWWVAPPTDYQRRNVAVTLPDPAPTGYGGGAGDSGLVDLVTDIHNIFMGDVNIDPDGGWVYLDVTDKTTRRVKYARKPAPGGRTVIRDPA